MKHVFVTTIRKHREETELIHEKTRKLSWIAGILVGAGSGGGFLVLLGLLGNGHLHTELGPHLAAALLGGLFGLLAFLVTRTNYRYGKLQELENRFQADVRAYAEGQYGIAVQHDIIQPDLTPRVGYGAGDGRVIAVEAHFADEDSPLTIQELTAKTAGQGAEGP